MVISIFKSTGIPPPSIARTVRGGYQRDGFLDLGEEGVQERLPLHEVDDEKYRDLVPAFALPSDSSQHSALIDVASGMNLVIEGPPGTGKSQTIVNLIVGAANPGK